MTTAASSPGLPHAAANPARPDAGSVRRTAAALAAASVTTGFGAAVAVWVVAWGLHLPGVRVAPGPTIAALGATLLGAVWFGAARAGRALAPAAGGLAGVIAAVICSMMLGSAVAEAPESREQMTEVANRLRENALSTALLFAAGAAGLGLIGGLLGAATGAARRGSLRSWQARFAVITAAAFLPLLGIGGAVTSTGSGLAVPEPVGAYGANPFLLPLSVMAGEHRIYLEHTHRLFGWLVGLTTIVLVAMTWLVRPRARALGIFAVVVLGLVIVQGVLGMWRVQAGTALAGAAEAVAPGQYDRVLAMLHGISGQVVFASAVLLAAVSADPVGDPRSGETAPPPATRDAARRAFGVVLVALGLVVFQLLTGAATRHLDDMHAGWTHVGMSVIAAGAVVGAAFALRAGDGYSLSGRRLRRVGGLIAVCVAAQFMLGLITVACIGIGGDGTGTPSAEELAVTPPVPFAAAIGPTSHQLLGAVLLSLLVVGAAWSARTRRAAG